jgi:hypothetical protein
MLDQTTPPPKPSVADIVHACVMAGRSAQDILTMSCEAHPAKSIDAIKAEIVGAFQAGVGKEVGAENLGKIGDAVARELDLLETDTPRPTVPAYRVVDRIVREAFKAAVESGEKEKLTPFSLLEAEAVEFQNHPSHMTIVSWLACWKLEDLNGELASKHGIYLACTVGSPEVEATQEDLDYEPPED